MSPTSIVGLGFVPIIGSFYVSRRDHFREFLKGDDPGSMIALRNGVMMVVGLTLACCRLQWSSVVRRVCMQSCLRNQRF
jgi:hypothetical protein